LTPSNITWNDRLHKAHPLHIEAILSFLIEGILHGTLRLFLCDYGFS
jgi:hypothetical protein